jgi:Fic family protein
VLRNKDKVDFESRFTDVDTIVDQWRIRHRLASSELREEFRSKLIISLIYHDAALEGDVLSHSEIKAAIDTNIISDTSLIPSYEEIINYNTAVLFALGFAGSKRKAIKLDTIREICGHLAPEAGATAPYRKENPLHRLYYHDISPPERISYRMRKLGEWLDSGEPKDLHPIRFAAELHWRLMAIFPWAKHSGRTARILCNLVLERSQFPLAVIHSIDRQRYYEALRSANSNALLAIYLEATEATATAALRVYDEAERRIKARRKAS